MAGRPTDSDHYALACEVGAAITSSLVLEDVLSTVAHRIAEAMGVWECDLYEYYPESQTIVSSATWSTDMTQDDTDWVGTAVTLNSLLDAAESEAAPAIALAAIKYADLSSGLQKDYTFDAERMVATTGDTGPYLQYTGARIASMLRKFEERKGSFAGGRYSAEALSVPVEWEIAVSLALFPETVVAAARDLNRRRRRLRHVLLSPALPQQDHGVRSFDRDSPGRSSRRDGYCRRETDSSQRNSHASSFLDVNCGHGLFHRAAG